MINKELKYKFHVIHENQITGLYKFEDRLTEDNKTHDDVVQLLKELKHHDIESENWKSPTWYEGKSWDDVESHKDEVAESFLLHFFNHEGHKHNFMVSSCGSVVIELVSD